jgi:hypothetical protein
MPQVVGENQVMSIDYLRAHAAEAQRVILKAGGQTSVEIVLPVQ